MDLYIRDCRNFSAEGIVDFFMELYPELYNRDNRRRVYVGATGNIKERLYRHNAKDNLLFCAQTAAQWVAAKVEEIANELGFEIGDVRHGGNGTNSKSIFVYAYLIDEHTIE